MAPRSNEKLIKLATGLAVMVILSAIVYSYVGRVHATLGSYLDTPLSGPRQCERDNECMLIAFSSGACGDETPAKPAHLEVLNKSIMPDLLKAQARHTGSLCLHEGAPGFTALCTDHRCTLAKAAP